jgi:hypothetical protein
MCRCDPNAFRYSYFNEVMNPSIVLVVLGGVVLLAILVIQIIVFDRLVRMEFHSYKEHWRKDGMPWAGSGAPVDVLDGFASSMAWKMCAQRWILTTPEWIMNDKIAMRRLTFLRALSFVAVCVMC